MFERAGFEIVINEAVDAAPKTFIPTSTKMSQVANKFVSSSDDNAPPLSLAHVMGSTWDHRRTNFGKALMKVGSLALRTLVLRKMGVGGRI